jgi:hypothetical protein
MTPSLWHKTKQTAPEKLARSALDSHGVKQAGEFSG